MSEKIIVRGGEKFEELERNHSGIGKARLHIFRRPMIDVPYGGLLPIWLPLGMEYEEWERQLLEDGTPIWIRNQKYPI